MCVGSESPKAFPNESATIPELNILTLFDKVLPFCKSGSWYRESEPVNSVIRVLVACKVTEKLEGFVNGVVVLFYYWSW
jgi:hypothetical protein